MTQVIKPINKTVFLCIIPFIYPIPSPQKSSMRTNTEHTFHIPVMGLGFTIDTPAKIAHLGISSVISIIEDHLIESMRRVLCKRENLEYISVSQEEQDCRAKRITAYLNCVGEIVAKNVDRLKSQSFDNGTELTKYFDLLPENSEAKQLYNKMQHLTGAERKAAQKDLLDRIAPGDIDVNIMTKVDKNNYNKDGAQLPAEFSDALAALRGFANSNLSSSVIFSAGLNPRLYSYCEKFADFFPDANGRLKKRIILKVSDFRSALIQGKFLAKKGLWVSEFRIESGLNCGGHAFATDGLLLGPILEEFKLKRGELYNELYEICTANLLSRGMQFDLKPVLKISAQGGIGTASENDFLREYYHLDATGWGSPFLLVPEATNVDEETLQKLATAEPDDYFLSHASPLGVPFHNFKGSSSEEQRQLRISKKRPGSPCYKKFLSFNTEFTEKPICTASREYQNLKIKQVKGQYTNQEELDSVIAGIVEKECLCEGLGASALLKNKAPLSHGLKAVAICPGPNLAYFSGVFTLKEMVDHIYGRTNLLNTPNRPHVFINELKLYVDYLKKEVGETFETMEQKKAAYYKLFRENLLSGIEYYKSLIPALPSMKEVGDEISAQLTGLRNKLNLIPIA